MEQEQTIETVNVGSVADTGFIRRVYMWMSLGLLTTSLVALVVVGMPSLILTLVNNPFLFWGLLIGEVLLVIYLSARINKMSSLQAQVVYFLYSALNGVTLSLVLLVYTASSIASVFLVTAGMFAVVSVYGFMTKKDLSGFGQYAFMALIGIVLATVVNMFMKNSGFDLFLSYAAVVVFVALTAYDTQKIKALNYSIEMGGDAEKKVAVLGALTLYLDFINLFLNLLRIMGKRN